jgi:hypothetical protein
MANAFLPLTRRYAAFRALLAALAPQAPASPRVAAAHAAPTGAARSPLKPLRVVRVLEPSASRSTAGRMVISGRLADVCAELDRLAALEAQGC